MAPVAPHRANIQQHRFVIGFSAFERRVAPLIPINGLMRGRPQIGAGGILQAIFGMCRQGIPFSEEIVRFMAFAQALTKPASCRLAY
jgi:hypothetical protein